MCARSYSHISHAPVTEWKCLYDSHMRVAAMRAQDASAGEFASSPPSWSSQNGITACDRGAIEVQSR